MLNEGLTGFVARSLPCALTAARREQQLHFQGHSFMLATANTTTQGLKVKKAGRCKVGRILTGEIHKSNGWEKWVFCIIKEKNQGLILNLTELFCC